MRAGRNNRAGRAIARWLLTQNALPQNAVENLHVGAVYSLWGDHMRSMYFLNLILTKYARWRARGELAGWPCQLALCVAPPPNAQLPCPAGPLWCPSSPQTMSRSSGEASAAAQAQARLLRTHTHRGYTLSCCCACCLCYRCVTLPTATRKMHFVNLGATLIQLSCSLAIVLIVRYALGGYWRSPTCLAATPAYPWTCE